VKISRRKLLKGAFAGVATAGATVALLRPDKMNTDLLHDWDKKELEPVPPDKLGFTTRQALPEDTKHWIEEQIELAPPKLEGFPAYSITNRGAKSVYWKRPKGWEPEAGTNEGLFARMSEVSASPIYPGGYVMVAGPIEILTNDKHKNNLHIVEYENVGDMCNARGFFI